MHAYICMFIYACLYMHVYVYICMFIYACLYMHSYTDSYMHVRERERCHTMCADASSWGTPTSPTPPIGG